MENIYDLFFGINPSFLKFTFNARDVVKCSQKGLADLLLYICDKTYSAVRRRLWREYQHCKLEQGVKLRMVSTEINTVSVALIVGGILEVTGPGMISKYQLSGF